MSNINQRLTEIINDYLKLKDVDAANLFSVSRQTITNIATSRSKPSWDVIDAISKAAPYVSAEWILRGNGEVLLSGGAASVVVPKNQISQNNGKSGTINIDQQHNEEIKKLLQGQIALQSETIEAQKAIIEAQKAIIETLRAEIARLNDRQND